MHEVDAPIETSNPSTFGVSEQVAYRGHSEVTMGRPIGIELEKTRPRGGVRIPPNVDYSVLDRRGSCWKSVEYVQAEGFYFPKDGLGHKGLFLHDELIPH